MPEIFRPSTSTSFGHFSRAGGPAGRNASTVSATASAATKPSSAVRAGGTPGRNTTDMYMWPGGLSHWRVYRPRPALCSRAHTTLP